MADHRFNRYTNYCERCGLDRVRWSETGEGCVDDTSNIVSISSQARSNKLFQIVKSLLETGTIKRIDHKEPQ